MQLLSDNGLGYEMIAENQVSISRIDVQYLEPQISPTRRAKAPISASTGSAPSHPLVLVRVGSTI
jgi:hypothetical protein